MMSLNILTHFKKSQIQIQLISRLVRDAMHSFIRFCANYLGFSSIPVHFNDAGEDGSLHLIVESLDPLLVVLEQVPEPRLRVARLL